MCVAAHRAPVEKMELSSPASVSLRRMDWSIYVYGSTLEAAVLLEFNFRHRALTNRHLLVPSAGF